MNRIFDADIELKDAGLLAASAACQVDSSDQILDLGSGRVEADIVIDVTVIDVDTGDEIYQVGVQVSDKADFASDINEVQTLKLGDAAVLAGDADMAIGRYVLPFNNLIANEVAKRYMRLYVTIAGTVVGGINFTAWATKR